jgi:hypothetical protein
MIRKLHILSLVLFLVRADCFAQAVKDNYSSASVLSSGKWFKMAVLKDGIYRIDYSKLTELGLANPSNPQIFANNFGQLSYYNNDPKPDDLEEAAIFLATGSDGIFNSGDYLLFYAQGTGRWDYDNLSGEYDYRRHNYSDTAFYFLTSSVSPCKKVANASEPSGAANYFSSESVALFIHEKESENLIQSGREWFQPASALQGTVINPQFSDLVTGEEVNFKIRVAARAPVSTQFRFLEGTVTHEIIQVPQVNMTNYTGTYAQITDSSGSAIPSSTSPVYELKFFNNGDPGAKGWIDFVKIQARKNNVFNNSLLTLSDKRSIGPGRIAEFSVNASSGSPVIWDITNPSEPENVQFIRSGNDISFKSEAENLHSYIVFSVSNAASPIIKASQVPNQDLHGSDPAEMIILIHPLFRKHAEELAALHLANSGLSSLIVTTSQVYNEFSGGIPDIVAIRNFVRMKYLKQAGTSMPLKYLLLFGDGSYENKTLPPRNPNFIPTYQSQISNIVVSSFTSDDFYGLLEDGEGEADGTEDIGIGRLPVSDTAQAGIVVRKIARYIDPSNNGDWKNVICITADDEDGNTHLFDAEGLAATLEDSVPTYNVEKIYLDAFRQITSVNGQAYPDVTTAINNRINEGCLIFNYVGHGNENGLTQERVVKTEDINSWKNGSKLPLFVTATCEFSRFDNVEVNFVTREMTAKTSAGEMVLLNGNGGGIALMSTTRVVYSAPNYYLNKNIYNAAFMKDSAGNPMRLGDIIRIAKNNSGSGPNKRNFSLLGDPAVRLSYPWNGVIVTDSINNTSINSGPDSLKALTKVTISGHIEDNSGITLNGFNGVVSPLVYDKSTGITTLANDGGMAVKFYLRNNILFSGKTTAKDGNFKFTFIVPRDIDYTFGPGKISYYANDPENSMTGFSNVIVGGFAETTATDTTGPLIRLFMNDTLFRNGGITDNSPRMLAIIEDEGGINTTGSGIGHDITGYLDNDMNRSFVLNSYFINDFDNYMKGRIEYNLADLPEGNHSLTIKAWDNFNNSSDETILFLVEKGGKFILSGLINYPNPVTTETRITAGHNRPEEELEVTVSIYDMSGRIIRILKSYENSTGYQLSPVIWDGNTEGGERVGKGMYPYRVTVTAGDGEKASGSGRMIIL